MRESSTSNERTPVELALFGLGFVSFLMAITGLVLTVPGLAILGTLGFLFVVCSFWVRAALAR